jgi:adenylosuccinate synthase
MDIVIGLQYGDEGKGKVINYLSESGIYDFCIRYNGGPNAGHTIYHQSNKIVTHQIPSGIVNNIPSLIGDNCYVDMSKLNDEIKYLEDNGIHFTTLFLSNNAHIIQESHINQDYNETKIGTTQSGIGPCSVDKYRRTGMKAGEYAKHNILNPKIIIVNTYEVIHNFYRSHKKYPKILIEGAQGFGLDITHGDYPYVTSSHCISTDCFNIGIPFHQLPKKDITIYGIAKVYETYVGAKEFQDNNDKTLLDIQEKGNEFGATTGRTRQCDYLNLSILIKSVWINQIDTLVFNKVDILKAVPDAFKVYFNNTLHTMGTYEAFKEKIESTVEQDIPWPITFIWSGSAHQL